MASVTSAGVGSGLDINGIITKLIAAERGPLTKLEGKESLARTRLSELGTLKSLLSTVETSVEAMDIDTETYSWKATSSDTTVSTATTGTGAASGTYALTVSLLAQAHTVKSGQAAGYAATTNTFNTGTVTITVGSEAAVNVSITASNNTLTGIRDAINTASGIDVTATIVNNGSTNYLVLASKNTGASNSVSVSVTDGGSGGTNALSQLATTSQTQAAQDASFTLNNIAITRSSNSVSDAVTGVTFSLLKAGSATVTVANDTSALTTKLNTFVSAYNALAAKVKTLTAYNSTTGTSGYFNGDMGITRVMTQLRDAIFSTPAGASASYTSMSSLGVRFKSDGTLSLDSTVLQTAMDSDFAAVAQTIGAYGAVMDTAADDMLSTTGIMATKNSSLLTLIDTLEDDQLTAERRLSSLEKRYRAQFTALDVLVSNLQTTSSYLSRQLANL